MHPEKMAWPCHAHLARSAYAQMDGSGAGLDDLAQWVNLPDRDG